MESKFTFKCENETTDITISRKEDFYLGDLLEMFRNFLIVSGFTYLNDDNNFIDCFESYLEEQDIDWKRPREVVVKLDKSGQIQEMIELLVNFLEDERVSKEVKQEFNKKLKSVNITKGSDLDEEAVF